MSTDANLQRFIDEYEESRAWDGGKDPETCRENAKKYAVSLFGNNVSRKGWFEYLESERGKSVAEATTKDVRGFLLYLKKEGLSEPTRLQARSGISLYYQLMDIDCENPVDGLKGSWRSTTDKKKATGKERNHPSKSEIRKMVENAPKPTLRSTLIIKLLYHTGCRRMELGTTKVENVDIDNREIRIYGDKIDEWRTVTFRESLIQPLNIWLQSKREDEAGYHDNNPYLFPSPTTRGNNDHISGQMISETVREAAEAADVQDTYGTDVNGYNQHTITPHALRHAFAVHAAENGIPAPHLKEMMGHMKLDVTQIYLNVAEESAVEIMKSKGPSLE